MRNAIKYILVFFGPLLAVVIMMGIVALCQVIT